MEDQQFCLKWSNHQSNMIDIFGRLLSNEALCDVTLACDGFSFKAHKLVLSASSSFFQNLFLENPCTHPIIILPELKYVDMKALVDFMYNGQVNVSESQLPKLLKAAENLRIKGLSDCRSQNATVHSNTGETSQDTSYLKMDCSEVAEQSKKQFEKESDSSSCNVEFHERIEMYSPEVCTDSQRSTVSSQKNSDGQNSSTGTVGPEVQTSQQNTDGSDLTSVSDTEIEMEPSKMMEQSMTTDHVFKSQSSDSNQDLKNDTIQEGHHSNGVEDSIPKDDACSDLPQSSDSSKETLATTACFTQDPCSSKDDKGVPESVPDDHTIFLSTPSVDEELALPKEKSIFVAGPSTTIVFETSTSQNQYSQGAIHPFGDVDLMKNGAKRGRRPGSRLCVLCKHIFSSESELEKHMENHKLDSNSNVSESKPFQEEIDSSESQVISEKNLVRLPVSCATCNCILNTMSDAQSHLSMNPNCRTSQFKCLLCPKLFIWPATLIKHFREQHQGPGGTARVTQRLWFFCDICKKPLLSKHALCLHRSKFHGFSTQSLGSESTENANVCKRGRKQGTRVCRLCKRTFTSSDEYHMHIQDFHRNNMLFNTAVETSSYVNESLSSTENESNSAQSVI